MLLRRDALSIPLLALSGVLVVAAGAAATPKKPTPGVPGRTIAVDVARVRGPHDKAFRLCVGAGRANEGLRADWQAQLATVHRECGFRYVRFHGLLHDDMMISHTTASGSRDAILPRLRGRLPVRSPMAQFLPPTGKVFAALSPGEDGHG